MPATIGLQLDPRAALHAWQETARDAGATPWYFAAEAVAAARTSPRDSNPVKAAEVTQMVADFGHAGTEELFYKGAAFGKWIEVPINLGYGVGPVTNLFTQARLYTFLSYRSGFQSALSVSRFTAEQAVHAYMRVALNWVEKWPGLTLATKSEREREKEELRRLETRQRLTDQQSYQATLALPLIVEKDLRDLIAAYDYAESSPSDPQRPEIPNGGDRSVVIAQQLTGRLRLAALKMLENPTLRPLSAYNILRASANKELGGALARARLTAGDFVLASVDNDVRTLLLNGTWPDLDPETKESYLRDSPAWHLVLGTPTPESDAR